MPKLTARLATSSELAGMQACREMRARLDSGGGEEVSRRDLRDGHLLRTAAPSHRAFEDIRRCSTGRKRKRASTRKSFTTSGGLLS